MKASILAAGLALLISSCASPEDVPLAAPQAEAQGKTFEAPPPGMGSVYVLHPTRAGFVFSVTIGPRLVGHLATRTWLRVDLPPGDYDLRATAEGALTMGALDLRIHAGQTTFVELDRDLWRGAAVPKVVSADFGRAAVAEGRRAREIR